MDTVYEDNFSSWNDVMGSYQMEESEPDEVYLAQYSYEDYSGSSTVIYRKGDQIYYNSGSHCSCYGLEGQWSPSEWSKEEFTKWYNLKIEAEKESLAKWKEWGYESDIEESKNKLKKFAEVLERVKGL